MRYLVMVLFLTAASGAAEVLPTRADTVQEALGPPTRWRWRNPVAGMT